MPNSFFSGLLRVPQSESNGPKFVHFSFAVCLPLAQSLWVIGRSLVSPQLGVLTFDKSSTNSCTFYNNPHIFIQCKLGMSNFLWCFFLMYQWKKTGNNVVGHNSFSRVNNRFGNIWIHSTGSGQHSVYRFSWVLWDRIFWLIGRDDFLNFMLFADYRRMMEDSNHNCIYWVFSFRRNMTPWFLKSCLIYSAIYK